MGSKRQRHYVIAREDDFFPRLIGCAAGGDAEVWTDMTDAVADARRHVLDGPERELVVCELVPVRRVMRTTKVTKEDSFDLAEVDDA